MRRLILLSMFFVTAISLGENQSIINAQDPTAEPTPEIRTSLFYGDTCAPPCWFGLIVGESTAEDAWTLMNAGGIITGRLVNYESNFIDPETGLLIQGAYDISLQNLPESLVLREDSCCANSGLIAVDDGIVSTIWMFMPYVVMVDETLSILGLPNIVYSDLQFNGDAQLHFLYEEVSITVELISSSETCATATLGQGYWIDVTAYRSEKSFEMQRNALSEWNTAVELPAEMWQAWLEDPTAFACDEVQEAIREYRLEFFGTPVP